MLNRRITRPIKNFSLSYAFPDAQGANYQYSGSIGYNDPGHSPDVPGSYSGSYDLRTFGFLVSKDGADYIEKATSTSFTVTVPVTDGTTSGSWSTIINPGVSVPAMTQLIDVVIAGVVEPAMRTVWTNYGLKDAALEAQLTDPGDVTYETPAAATASA